MNERTPSSFVGRPVRSLQHMLRVAAQQDARIPMVVPDGIFGQVTLEAVRAFQKTAELPPTGNVDQRTWEHLVLVFDLANVEQQSAQPLIPILNAGQALKSGTDNLHICLVQAILHVLSLVYCNLPDVGMTGRMDAPTMTAVRRFQTVSGLPVTGQVDKGTWRHLALHYALAAGNGECAED